MPQVTAVEKVASVFLCAWLAYLMLSRKKTFWFTVDREIIDPEMFSCCYK